MRYTTRLGNLLLVGIITVKMYVPGNSRVCEHRNQSWEQYIPVGIIYCYFYLYFNVNFAYAFLGASPVLLYSASIQVEFGGSDWAAGCVERHEFFSHVSLTGSLRDRGGGYGLFSRMFLICPAAFIYRVEDVRLCGSLALKMSFLVNGGPKI